MPPEIFVIMGRVGIGKSSTIRALTGLFHGGKTDVQTVQGTLKNIYVEIRSLQEKGILPSKFISDHNNDTYILLSLRIDSFKGYPNGLTYLQAFINNNWQVKEIDGHSVPQILDAVEFAQNSKDKPTVILAKTVKGKGVPFMENDNTWHQKSLTDEEFKLARAGLQ